MAHILIAEHNDSTKNYLVATLKKAGHTVITADNCLDAWRISSKENFDILLVDIVMPGVDGFAVVERLRADPSTASMPIVILTSKTMTREEKERLNGQISYLAHKAEFNRSAFVQLVQSFAATTQ